MTSPSWLNSLKTIMKFIDSHVQVLNLMLIFLVIHYMYIPKTFDSASHELFVGFKCR